MTFRKQAAKNCLSMPGTPGCSMLREKKSSAADHQTQPSPGCGELGQMVGEGRVSKVLRGYGGGREVARVGRVGLWEVGNRKLVTN